MKRCSLAVLTLCLSSLGGAASGSGVADVPLTQADLLERLLNENARARFIALESEIAETEVDYEQGFYQASVYARVRGSSEQTPNSAEDTITRFERDTAVFEEERTEVELGVRLPLRSGGELTLGWSGIRRDNTFTEDLDQGGSEYIGGLDLSLRQPLWRNAMGREQALSIRQAELASERTGFDREQQLLDLAFQGLRQYWLLYRREQFEAIDREAVDTADQTLSVTRDLVAAGLQPEVAELEVEARLVERAAELRSSRSAVAETRGELDTLLNRDPEDPGAGLLRVADRPEQRRVLQPEDFAVYTRAVLTQWPEYQAVALTREIERQRLAAAEESGKPSADLLLGYSTSALGRQRSRIWGDSLSNDYPSWYAGMELEVKLGADRRSRALANAARLRMDQAEIDADAIRINVASRLATRLEQAEAAFEQMELMQRRETLQQRIFERQEDRFEAGQVPVRVLHEAMDDLIEAQRKAVDARVAYQLAIIALRLVEGSLFVEHGISDGQSPTLDFEEAADG